MAIKNDPLSSIRTYLQNCEPTKATTAALNIKEEVSQIAALLLVCDYYAQSDYYTPNGFQKGIFSIPEEIIDRISNEKIKNCFIYYLGVCAAQGKRSQTATRQISKITDEELRADLAQEISMIFYENAVACVKEDEWGFAQEWVDVIPLEATKLKAQWLLDEEISNRCPCKYFFNLLWRCLCPD